MARIKKQLKAAAELGVSTVTLRGWVHQSWWKEDFLTAEGYDCEAIRKANPNTAEQEHKRTFDGNSRRINEGIKSLELALKQMDFKERQGELVSVDWVIGFLSETESMLISSVLDIAPKLAKLVPEGPIRVRILDEGEQIIRNILRSHSEQVAGYIEQAKAKTKKRKR